MSRVLIIDDHPVTRLALRILLESKEYIVASETGDGFEGISMAKTLQPDLVIVDIDIPSINGIEVVNRLRRLGFSGYILVLTGKREQHYINLSIKAGANGYISKENNLSELHDAIRAIQSGYSYFPMPVLNNKQTSSIPDSEGDFVSLLSARELQILKYLASGMKNIDISKIMKLSDKTISTYKTRLLKKLRMSNQVELANFARRHNLD
ncbi:response regulator [Pantoea sp. NPDC088449]|uniref:Two component transcriptional regulator, LuxR family n=1 Tax=Candidatus Pantoea floridensis TaxID=1938870 RepID=A0A286BVF4_9GAMM|nr:response regulator transcription factor [Pantoea floridensis]PIF14006.1 LuxR family two component transcriptional regulator [Enterobacteriaceae bacterium JKS000233]SOD38105.1 two component transcriptional regulator, LuxR family [Pantoea floridensis]HBZ14568.1 DNA-binding response regulator [Pantoea sp.]